jgi:hypothetical protein
VTDYSVVSDLAGLPVHAIVADLPREWQVVSGSEAVAEAVQASIQARLGDREPTLDDLGSLAASSGYLATSDWAKSPLDFEQTVARLRDEFVLARQVAPQQRLQLEAVRAASDRLLGTEGDRDAEGDSLVERMTAQRYGEFLEDAGLRERFSRPGLGYPVPDDVDAEIALLTGGEQSEEASESA